MIKVKWWKVTLNVDAEFKDMIDASDLNFLKNINRQHNLLAAHGTTGQRARVHKSLQDGDQTLHINVYINLVNNGPTMSDVVEKLKAALELKELHDLKLQREHEQEEILKAAGFDYGEIFKLADRPLIYKSVKELTS
ncbi:hypothetical protein Tco_0424938 [Tanacetum coccineum]